MHMNRKMIVMVAMAIVVTTAVAFTTPPADDPGYKNLKILPKDISHEDLHKVMKQFNNALGVKCGFCHAPSKDTTVSKWPDFASDDKPEKSIARAMMKMTLNINKKFFAVKNPSFGGQLEITCVTCHHGEPHPEAPEMNEEEHHNPPPPPPAEKQ